MLFMLPNQPPFGRNCAGCKGQGVGGVCGCAVAHVPAHTFRSMLLLHATSEGEEAYPSDEEVKAELTDEIRSEMRDLSRQVHPHGPPMMVQ